MFAKFHHASPDHISLIQWLCVPFAMSNEAVEPIGSTATEWLGRIEPNQAGLWVDSTLMLVSPSQHSGLLYSQYSLKTTKFCIEAYTPLFNPTLGPLQNFGN